MKAFITILLPLLIVSWIGGVMPNFNVLIVAHFNGQPFDHYSSVAPLYSFVVQVLDENRNENSCNGLWFSQFPNILLSQ